MVKGERYYSDENMNGHYTNVCSSIKKGNQTHFGLNKPLSFLQLLWVIMISLNSNRKSYSYLFHCNAFIILDITIIYSIENYNVLRYKLFPFCEITCSNFIDSNEIL